MSDETDQINNTGNSQSDRPISVSILVMLVLFFTTINGIQVFSALTSWDFLVALLPTAPMFYIVIGGAIWFFIGLILTVGLFTGKKWTLVITRIAILVYLIYFWIDRFVIAEIIFIQNRWQFFLGLSILLVVLSFWMLEQKKSKLFLVK